MNKALAILATLLLAGTVGFAQAGQAGNQSDQSSMGQSQNTIRGCVSGTKGNFTLMANDGTTYQLKGHDSQLAKNVGKEVEIETSSKTNAMASPSGGMAGQAAAGNTETLQVKNVKQVADTCQNSGMQQPSSPSTSPSGHGGQGGNQPDNGPRTSPQRPGY